MGVTAYNLRRPWIRAVDSSGGPNLRYDGEEPPLAQFLVFLPLTPRAWITPTRPGPNGFIVLVYIALVPRVAVFVHFF